MDLAAFMNGLEVRFTAPVSAVTPNGRFWFLVTVEYPDANRGIVIDHHVLDEAIVIANDVARFAPHKNFAQTFLDAMNRGLERALVRVVVKCNLIVDAKMLPVDGDFLRAAFPTGDSVPGGDFESCFFLRR
jgi:hypothetical protein